MQTIREDCKSGNFKPVYLLYGEEPYLKQQAREMLRKAIAGTDTLNVTTSTAGNTRSLILWGWRRPCPLWHRDG